MKQVTRLSNIWSSIWQERTLNSIQAKLEGTHANRVLIIMETLLSMQLPSNECSCLKDNWQ